MNRHDRRAVDAKALQGAPLNDHEQAVQTRMAALEQAQKVSGLILTDYFKALMLLTEGTRATLAGAGMAHQDIVANLASVVGKMGKHIEEQRGVLTPANGADEQTEKTG